MDKRADPHKMRGILDTDLSLLSPAVIAARHGHLDVVYELKKHGGTFDLKPEDYQSAAIKLVPDLFNKTNLAGLSIYTIERLISPKWIQALCSKLFSLNDLARVDEEIRQFEFSIVFLSV